MIGEISSALRSVNPAARTRLLKCLPRLAEALSNMTSPPQGGLTLAAATPSSAVVLAVVDGFPDLDRCAAVDFTPCGPALALAGAIEGKVSSDQASDVVVIATAVLLGEKGLAQHREDTARILRSGGLPLTIVMIEQSGDRDAVMMCTTTTVDGVSVH